MQVGAAKNISPSSYTTDESLSTFEKGSTGASIVDFLFIEPSERFSYNLTLASGTTLGAF